MADLLKRHVSDGSEERNSSELANLLTRHLHVLESEEPKPNPFQLLQLQERLEAMSDDGVFTIQLQFSHPDFGILRTSANSEQVQYAYDGTIGLLFLQGDKVALQEVLKQLELQLQASLVNDLGLSVVLYPSGVFSIGDSPDVSSELIKELSPLFTYRLGLQTTEQGFLLEGANPSPLSAGISQITSTEPLLENAESSAFSFSPEELISASGPTNRVTNTESVQETGPTRETDPEEPIIREIDNEEEPEKPSQPQEPQQPQQPQQPESPKEPGDGTSVGTGGNKTPQPPDRAAPEINNITTPQVFLENVLNAAPNLIATGAAISDADSEDFADGELEIRFADNGFAEDQLSIADIGEISLVAQDIVHDAAGIIGRVSAVENGVNGSPLVIALNELATPALTAQILQALSYQNTSDTPQTMRQLQIRLQDETGTVGTIDIQLDITRQGEITILTSATDDDTAYTDGADMLSGTAVNWHDTDTVTGGGGSDTLTITSGGVTMDTSVYVSFSGVESLILQQDAAHNITIGDAYFLRAALENNTLSIDASASVSSDVRIDASSVTEGNMEVRMGGGDDTLLTGEGDDTIFAGEGVDNVQAGGGDDIIRLGWSNISNVPVSDNLIAHFDASNASSITTFPGAVSLWEDESGSGNDATDDAGTVQSGSQLIGPRSSLDFDGSSSLTIANTNDINLVAQDERSVFVTFETGSNINALQVIYEQGGGVNGFNLYIHNGQLYIGAWKDDGGGFGLYHSTALSTNTVYTAGFVFDNATTDSFQSYLNGVAVDSSPVTTTQNAHSGNIAIGGMKGDTRTDSAAQSGDGLYFDGEIAEVLNYNDALTAAEITSTSQYLINKWHGSAEQDTLAGGTGNDTLEAASALIANLNGTSTLTGIEVIDLRTHDGHHAVTVDNDFFSAGEGIEGDILTIIGSGNSAAITVNATAVSSSNTVVIRPGEGDDRIDGGALDFSEENTAINANLTTGIVTGIGTDTVTSLRSLTGSSRDDTIIGSFNADRLEGSEGDDAISGEVDISSAALVTTNLVLHLDASDTASITGHPGNVTVWDDLSTENNDATDDRGFAVSGSNSINGLNVLSFDGNDFMQVVDSADINTTNQDERSEFWRNVINGQCK